MNNIQDYAVLAVLTKGAWRARKGHKEETQAENARHSTAGNVSVSVLLSKSKTLEAIKELHSEAYGVHCDLTLPSETENMRFLPRAKVQEHSAKMEEFKIKHNELVATFEAEYPAIKEQAKVELNGLYREEFFPPLAKVLKKFKFVTKYLDVPSEGKWQDWIAESLEQAQEDLREQLRACLRRVVENCSKENPRIYETLTGNLRGLAEMIGAMGMLPTEFQQIAEAAKPITLLSAQDLRDDPALRKETAQQAAQIMAKFLS